ncbi:hypothetical protein [Micromonospora sp. NPDC005806]
MAAEFLVREVLFTATTADTFTVLRRFPLTGGDGGDELAALRS